MKSRIGVTKKWRTVPITRDVAWVLDGLSKQALLDCLVDALTAEPEELTLERVAEHCNPRLLVREDTPINPEKVRAAIAKLDDERARWRAKEQGRC